jgi:hypothetical protein
MRVYQGRDGGGEASSRTRSTTVPGHTASPPHCFFNLCLCLLSAFTLHDHITSDAAGDYWNSKYWLSHIRSHPTVSSIPDAKAFVDACEAVKAKSGTSRNRRQGGAAGTKVGGSQETKAGVGADGAGQDEETKLRVKQWEELKRLILWTRENCVL